MAAKSDPIVDYVSGAIAGSSNIVVGYPFDTGELPNACEEGTLCGRRPCWLTVHTAHPSQFSPPCTAVKVRLQAKACPYSGPWQCFTSIARNEGVKGVFRGLSSPLVGGALETGVNYSVYKASLRFLRDRLPEPLAVPLSAAIAGFWLSFIVSPAELIKCRLQLGAADRAHVYTGPVDCMRQVVQSEGYRGLFRGLGATMAREMPGNTIYFGSYSIFSGMLLGRQKHDTEKMMGDGSLRSIMVHSSSAIVAGAGAGIAMWTAVLPLDVAKTRIQTAWPGTPQDVGIAAHLQQLWREGGRRRLYAGLTPTLIRAAPANAAQWLTWEWCMQMAHRWEVERRGEARRSLDHDGRE
jgi:solute carrier family 25 (mitochondrial carnitine/acylcarnitine transporter), member 20/29